MKVAYFDLGISREEYSLTPTRYGGGAVAARYLKQDRDIDFHVFAPQQAFDNLTPEDRTDRCFVLSPDACEALKRGYPIDRLPGLDIHSFDLVLHPHTCQSLNKGGYRGPLVHFAGFDGSCGNPHNDYVLLYDPSFRAQFGERAKYVRIGKPVPSTFIHSVKEPFVFQCSRLEGCMGAMEAAKACLATGIKGIFAGPIREEEFRQYIDGVTTVYLGEVGEQEKLDYCRRATLFMLLMNWNMPFNQSIIEAQGQGTPIWANKRGPFLETYLKHTVNGFDASLFTLEQAFHSARTVDMQKECWEAASQYSVPVMCESFKRAFREIVAEWVAR